MVFDWLRDLFIKKDPYITDSFDSLVKHSERSLGERYSRDGHMNVLRLYRSKAELFDILAEKYEDHPQKEDFDYQFSKMENIHYWPWRIYAGMLETVLNDFSAIGDSQAYLSRYGPDSPCKPEANWYNLRMYKMTKGKYRDIKIKPTPKKLVQKSSEAQLQAMPFMNAEKWKKEFKKFIYNALVDEEYDRTPSGTESEPYVRIRNIRVDYKDISVFIYVNDCNRTGSYSYKSWPEPDNFPDAVSVEIVFPDDVNYSSMKKLVELTDDLRIKGYSTKYKASPQQEELADEPQEVLREAVTIRIGSDGESLEDMFKRANY